MISSRPNTVLFIKQEKAWQKKSEAIAAKVGEQAPEFKLVDVNGENSVRLSNFYSRKPVELVFGSFT